MEKQINTGKIGKNNQMKNRENKIMRMTTAGRKPIACWPKTNAKGGVESTLRGDARKDR